MSRYREILQAIVCDRYECADAALTDIDVAFQAGDLTTIQQRDLEARVLSSQVQVEADYLVRRGSAFVTWFQLVCAIEGGYVPSLRSDTEATALALYLRVFGYKVWDPCTGRNWE